MAHNLIGKQARIDWTDQYDIQNRLLHKSERKRILELLKIINEFCEEVGLNRNDESSSYQRKYMDGILFGLAIAEDTLVLARDVVDYEKGQYGYDHSEPDDFPEGDLLPEGYDFDEEYA